MALRTVAFRILFAVTAMVYAVMVGWSLPAISGAAQLSALVFRMIGEAATD